MVILDGFMKADKIIKQIKALGFKEDPNKNGYYKDVNNHQLFFSMENIIKERLSEAIIVKNDSFLQEMAFRECTQNR